MSDAQTSQATDDAAAMQQWSAWIRADMATRGWSREEATQLVATMTQHLQNAARNAAFQKDALVRAAEARHGKNMLYGGIWCVGGTIVTVGTYAAASSGGGGRYVVAW